MADKVIGAVPFVREMVVIEIHDRQGRGANLSDIPSDSMQGGAVGNDYEVGVWEGGVSAHFRHERKVGEVRKKPGMVDAYDLFAELSQSNSESYRGRVGIGVGIGVARDHDPLGVRECSEHLAYCG